MSGIMSFLTKKACDETDDSIVIPSFEELGMKEPAMAALWRDNQIIPVCVGCTMMLEFCGMLTRLRERVLNPRQPDFIFAVYVIARPYTLEDCQKIVADRHRGNAGEKWGEMP
jgi:hypothetical protein